jgi:uncharacterized 2Fe-2S/4Fe-4S cluster protein (DUF4445 family)
MKEYRVLFAPSLKEVSGKPRDSILEIAREAGVFVDSQCNGKGTCGKCRVRVIEGEVNPFTQEESRFISEVDQENGYRLACLTRLSGDVTVLVPEENILTQAVAKKTFAKRSKTICPAVRTYSVDLSEKGKTRGNAYFERVAGRLAEAHGLSGLTCDLLCLQALGKAVREGGDQITVFVWMDKEIVAVRPGRCDVCLGLALDIGTTTVAVYLCDLNSGDVIASGSLTNPQVLYGTDIMSRISYSVNHPGAGTKRMQQELLGAVNALVERLASQRGFSVQDIFDMTVVGNTVMHHIFLALAPDHLGAWPFIPAVSGSVNVKSRDIGVLINPSAYVHVLPVEAGFVGADNVGVLLSEEPYNKGELSLVVDLGTNGELVLGNREKLLSCSCATGPALEGAHISNGMRATKGAIERVRIEQKTLDADYTVVGRQGWKGNLAQRDPKPVGICGSGIIDAVAQLFKTGIIRENGTFSGSANSPRIRKGASGVMEYVIAWKGETATGKDIVLTQKDIRQIQLAKAALHGGCRVLMGHLQVDSIRRMVVAGAFGMHIDKENALTLGLFPWCPPENIRLVGNAAGHGAYLALMDREKRAEADRVARTVIHIELALEKNFRKEFISALSIPYKSGTK